MGIYKGYEQSEEHVFKRSKSMQRGKWFNCLVCEKEFWRKPFAIKKGQNKFCSKPCYFVWQKGKKKIVKNPYSKSNENNPNWRGGIQPINLKIRGSRKYKKWKSDVLKRDSYTCQECGEKGIDIIFHAHHIKPFAKFPEVRFFIDNGQTLCKKCHDKKPKGETIWLIN